MNSASASRPTACLYEMVPPPRHLAFAITTRIKVMANLDIAERRLPQDGRIELNVGGHPVDLRDQRAADDVRRKRRHASARSLGDFAGLDTRRAWTTTSCKQFREVINKPNGIILVTGPTGCGKTTTLYAALSELNKVSDKIITTEDPVEYDIDGISRCRSIRRSATRLPIACGRFCGKTPTKFWSARFATWKRPKSPCRPRSPATPCSARCTPTTPPARSRGCATWASRAFLITATLEGILAQRLVRRICAQCREEVMPTAEMLADLELNSSDIEGKKFYRGRGCDNCNRTGYRGRVGLFEMMTDRRRHCAT